MKIALIIVVMVAITYINVAKAILLGQGIEFLYTGRR